MTLKPYKKIELGQSPDALEQRREELFTLISQIAPELVSDHQIDLNRLKELLGLQQTDAEDSIYSCKSA